MVLKIYWPITDQPWKKKIIYVDSTLKFSKHTRVLLESILQFDHKGQVDTPIKYMYGAYLLILYDVKPHSIN